MEATSLSYTVPYILNRMYLSHFISPLSPNLAFLKGKVIYGVPFPHSSRWLTIPHFPFQQQQRRSTLHPAKLDNLNFSLLPSFWSASSSLSSIWIASHPRRRGSACRKTRWRKCHMRNREVDASHQADSLLHLFRGLVQIFFHCRCSRPRRWPKRKQWKRPQAASTSCTNAARTRLLQMRPWRQFLSPIEHLRVATASSGLLLHPRQDFNWTTVLA